MAKQRRAVVAPRIWVDVLAARLLLRASSLPPSSASGLLVATTATAPQRRGEDDVRRRRTRLGGVPGRARSWPRRSLWPAVVRRVRQGQNTARLWTGQGSTLWFRRQGRAQVRVSRWALVRARAWNADVPGRHRATRSMVMQNKARTGQGSQGGGGTRRRSGESQRRRARCL